LLNHLCSWLQQKWCSTIGEKLGPFWTNTEGRDEVLLWIFLEVQEKKNPEQHYHKLEKKNTQAPDQSKPITCSLLQVTCKDIKRKKGNK
jgi:hypothetical protein